MRSEGADIKERIKTSEFLAKTCGMFLPESINEAGEGPTEGLSLSDKLRLIEEIKNV